MNATEYQEMSKRTMPEAGEVKVYIQLLHAMSGLGAEVGEILSEFQHALQERRDIKPEYLCKEIGDVLWFIAEMCTALGVDMSSIMEVNIEKLAKRYPEGFDVWRSEHRHELEEDDV